MDSHIGSPHATVMILASGPFSSVIQKTPTGLHLDQAARKGRLVEQDQRVERVAVLGQRVGDEPVVGRVDRRREEPAVESDQVPLVVVLVLVAAPPGDLDDDLDGAVCVHGPCLSSAVTSLIADPALRAGSGDAPDRAGTGPGPRARDAGRLLSLADDRRRRAEPSRQHRGRRRRVPVLRPPALGSRLQRPLARPGRRPGDPPARTGQVPDPVQRADRRVLPGAGGRAPSPGGGRHQEPRPQRQHPRRSCSATSGLVARPDGPPPGGTAARRRSIPALAAEGIELCDWDGPRPRPTAPTSTRSSIGSSCRWSPPRPSTRATRSPTSPTSPSTSGSRCAAGRTASSRFARVKVPPNVDRLLPPARRAIASSRSSRSWSPSSTSSSPAWTSASPASSGSPATPTSRSTTTRPTISSSHCRRSCAVAASFRSSGSRSTRAPRRPRSSV